MRRGGTRAVLALAVALAGCGLAGCGATQPQPPSYEAKRLDDATGGISSACGEAAQVTAYPGDHGRDLATIDAAATSKAHELEAVYSHNSRWIYYDETVRMVVSDSISMLGQCGLTRAAADLRRATGAR